MAMVSCRLRCINCDIESLFVHTRPYEFSSHGREAISRSAGNHLWMECYFIEHTRSPDTKQNVIGHFRIISGLFFKASPGAHLFIWKLVFICMWMKTNFHMKGWAPGLALKKRLTVIRKWPIWIRYHSPQFYSSLGNFQSFCFVYIVKIVRYNY